MLHYPSTLSKLRECRFIVLPFVSSFFSTVPFSHPCVYNRGWLLIYVACASPHRLRCVVYTILLCTLYPPVWLVFTLPLCQPLQQTCLLNAGPIFYRRRVSVPEKNSQRPNHAENNVTPIVASNATNSLCMHRASRLSHSLSVLSRVLKRIRDDVEPRL